MECVGHGGANETGSFASQMIRLSTKWKLAESHNESFQRDLLYAQQGAYPIHFDALSKAEEKRKADLTSSPAAYRNVVHRWRPRSNDYDKRVAEADEKETAIRTFQLIMPTAMGAGRVAPLETSSIVSHQGIGDINPSFNPT